MQRRHGQKFAEQLRGCATTCRRDVSPTSRSAAIDAPPAQAMVGLGIPIVIALVGSLIHATDVRRHRCRGDAKLWFRQEGEKQ